MKCGSTTLFRDLDASPEILFPVHKEPHNLLNDRVLTESGRHEYSNLYKGAKSSQLLGDASTGYTKLPIHTGVPERAKSVLGANVKIVYIIRNPVDRIQSHYRHLLSRPNAMQSSFEEVLAAYPEVLEYSCYGQQLQAWREYFDEEAVLVLCLEDHKRDRVNSTNTVCAHIGAEPCGHLIDTDTAWNKSDSKPVARGPLGPIVTSNFYRQYIRPLLGNRSRDFARNLLLPKAKSTEIAWTDSLWKQCEKRLTEDAQLLRFLTNDQFGSNPDWLKPPMIKSR